MSLPSGQRPLRLPEPLRRAYLLPLLFALGCGALFLTLLQQRCMNLEIRKVVFLKTHKTGSTTLGNIVFRWASKERLRILCPRRHYLSFEDRTLAKGNYDVALHHFKPGGHKLLAELIPSGHWITALRQPISRFLSSYYYFVRPVSRKTLTEVLSEQNDLKGFQSSFEVATQEQFQDFLVTYWPKISVVVVTERWAESMVMLKTKLGWKWEDVLYIPRNTCDRGKRYDGKAIACPPPIDDLTTEVRAQIEDLLRFESQVYRMAVAELDKFISQHGAAFHQELAYFSTQLQELWSRCPNETAQEGACEEYYLLDLHYETLACKLPNTAGYAKTRFVGAEALLSADRRKNRAL